MCIVHTYRLNLTESGCHLCSGLHTKQLFPTVHPHHKTVGRVHHNNNIVVSMSYYNITLYIARDLTDLGGKPAWAHIFPCLYIRLPQSAIR